MSVLQNPAHGQDRAVGRLAHLDSGLDGACMHDVASSDIDADVSVIADQITRLRLGVGNLFSRAPLCIGGTGQIVAKVLIYLIGKAGAVRAVGKAGAAVYIGISDELTAVTGNLLSKVTAGSVVDDVRNVGAHRVGTLCGVLLPLLVLQLL